MALNLSPQLPFNITPASLLSGANTIAGLLSKSSKVDVVQVIDQTSMKQLFHGARPIKLHVKETSKVMDYPVETGVTLSDHHIILPTEFEMDCIIPATQYSIAYPAIRNAWLNATLLSVQTRLGTYRNIIISDEPHTEDADMFSAVSITLKMREVIMFAPNGVSPGALLANFQPANPAKNGSNISSGIVSATAAVGSALSYLHAASVVGIRI